MMPRHAGNISRRVIDTHTAREQPRARLQLLINTYVSPPRAAVDSGSVSPIDVAFRRSRYAATPRRARLSRRCVTATGARRCAYWQV